MLGFTLDVEHFVDLAMCMMIPGLPGGPVVKNLPAKQSSRVRSLGWEDPLEEEMATHSSVLPWEVSRTEEPNGLQSMGSKQSDTTDRVNNSKQQMIIIASYRGVPLP